MLTMERLFYSDEKEKTIKMIKKAKIPKLSKINSKINPLLEKIILRALHKKARKRFQTAFEFKTALESLTDNLTINIRKERIGALMADLWPQNTKESMEKTLKSV
jgi:serine/threonine protein kinase